MQFFDIIADKIENNIVYSYLLLPDKINMEDWTKDKNNKKREINSNSAKIRGIDNKVDLNVFKGNLQELNNLIMRDLDPRQAKS